MMMLYAGIDAGSRAIKAVLWDAADRRVVSHRVADQGVEHVRLARTLLNDMLTEAGVVREALMGVLATGYGRHSLEDVDHAVTEITCHARGVYEQRRDVQTIIEIGGQDSKAIRLGPRGSVEDFAMNDRCAAGTGCYLEMVARRLDVDVSSLGRMAGKSQTPAQISSMCAVFAETEIIGLLASGTQLADIVAGVQLSVARRVSTMAGRMIREPVVLTGGVAMIEGMVEAFTQVLERPVEVAPLPQLTGALGAAIIASERVRRQNRTHATGGLQ